MKKIVLFACALLVMSMSCSQSSQVDYRIKGTIHGMNDEMIYLYTAEGATSLLDSALVSNDSFTFKGTYEKPIFALISASIARTSIYLENGIINVVIDSQNKVSGTPVNDRITECEKRFEVMNEISDKLLEERSEIKMGDKKAYEVLRSKWSEMWHKKVAIAKECVLDNSNNVVGAYYFRQYEDGMSDADFDEIMKAAGPVMKEHIYTKDAVAHHNGVERSQVGQKFTDFKLNDPNGKEVALSDYVGKGKYVFLEFWASWCNPCRMEIPYLKAAYKKYAAKGFEIVGVSLDTTKEDWMKAIEKYGINWPQMSDLKRWQSEAATLYGIRGIPTALLIDPNGVIIANSGMRHEQLDEKLSEIFK